MSSKKKEITEQDKKIAEDYISLMEISDIAKKYNTPKELMRKKLSYLIYRGIIPKGNYQELRAQKRRQKIATYALKTSPEKAVVKFGTTINTVLKALREERPELVSFGKKTRSEKNYRDTKTAFGDRIIQIIKDGGKLSDIKSLNSAITYNTMRLIIQPVFGKEAYNTLLKYDEKKKRQKQEDMEVQTRKYALKEFEKAKLSQEKPDIWSNLSHTVLRLSKNKDVIIEQFTQTIETHYKDTGEVLEKEWDALQDMLIEHLDEEAQDKIKTYEITKEAGLRVCFKCPYVYGYAVKKMGVLKFYKLYKK